jgi:hypothetical protein
MATAAHRTLLIPELAGQIVGHCVDYYYHTSLLRKDQEKGIPHLHTRSRATLKSLSRTCRSISPHALDILWAQLPDVNVLLKLVPVYYGESWDTELEKPVRMRFNLSH